VKVGFRVPYRRGEAVTLCLQVAQLAYGRGYDVEFASPCQPEKVDPFWDRTLVTRDMEFEDWVGMGVEYVVYTHQPSPAELRAVKRHGVKPIMLACWELLDEAKLRDLASFHQVVCPTKATHKLLEHRLGSANLAYIPWDSGLPFTSDDRETDRNRVGVFWPLAGGQQPRQEKRFLQVLSHLVESRPNAWVTVTYSSDLPSDWLRDLKRLATFADGRLELLKDVETNEHELLYGRHDLTLWPSLVESVPLVGLASLSMGVPVVGFDHPVIGEVVKDGRNGRLIPCGLTSDVVGVPRVEPDYQAFGRTLVELVGDPVALSNLRHQTKFGLPHRREAFQQAWDKLFTDGVP
jgi:glycosyltransferase involved in cell wall biosynthesis